MKKSVALILVLSLLFSSCSLVPGNTKQTGDSQAITQEDKNIGSQGSSDKSNPQDKDSATKDAKPNEGSSQAIAAGNPVSIDASVEALVRVEEDFLDAAFEGDIDGILAFCNDTFAGEVEKAPKKYIGTKPDYTIDKVDTMIKILGSGRYLLQSVVSAANKTDKKKYDFKYSTTIEKIKDDYWVADFKRDSK